MWMRTKFPILPDEDPSPFQEIAPLADCGNGISYNGHIADASFVNPDLTSRAIQCLILVGMEGASS